MTAQRLILASASPRRKELLSLLGVAFEVMAADVDESVLPGELPRAYVERLARSKALKIGALDRDALALAADTSVVVDSQILGKPGHDEAAGLAMLKLLSGRSHLVMTGIAVASGRRVESQVIETTVEFRELSDSEMRWYVKSGEGADKAGGYGLQARAGAFITSLHGSSTSVIGLPLAETALLLQRSGLVLPWSAP